VTALLELDHVCKKFHGNTVLDNVSLSVSKGEIVTLIGPNGSGKSTLMRIALGLEKPDQGRVQRQPKLRIGYMPQKVNVEATMPLTVKRFLELRPKTRLDGIKRRLDEVRGGHLLDKPFRTLSGGEMQRVLLARAILGDPDFLVLDEPVQGVDIVGQEELYELIGNIRDRHQCGVLMVSHDLHLVMAQTDHVLCLNKHVCCHGAPDKIIEHPDYLSLFGASSQNIAVYSHHHDHHHDAAGQVIPGEHTEHCRHD